MKKKQIVIFTDLDGTLLDKSTFKFDKIEKYFRELILKDIIIIPSSSKTEAELLDFNKQYNLNLSFIAENGSSIHRLDLIHKNLPEKILLSKPTDEIYKIYKQNITPHLKRKITFILNLKSKEQEEIFGLPLDKMTLAIKRNHSLPIIFNDNVNKSKAMNKALQIITKKLDDKIITIGVGDNENDIEMIKQTNYPCLVKNDNFNSSLINIDNLIKSSEPSPRGWSDVIKTAIQKIKT